MSTPLDRSLGHHSSAPHLRPVTHWLGDLRDWGAQPDPVEGGEGRSHNWGKLLWKGPDNRPESGLWLCTPGRWRLTLVGDELCHFLAGRATYTGDNGEVIEVCAGTVVQFLEGWSGECTVHETIRVTYMLR